MLYIIVHVQTMRYSIETNFLTVAEISDLLRLSVLTIYKYIKSGKLDAVEFGGHYRISKASLNLFIANHKVHVQDLKASCPEGEK